MIEADYSKKEEIFYSLLFDQHKHGLFVQGKEVFELFMKSNLNRNQLKQIWELSSVRKMPNLNKEEFMTSCRFVALAQKGFQCSEDNFYYRKDIGLAFFSGIDYPNFEDDHHFEKKDKKNMDDLIMFLEKDLVNSNNNKNGNGTTENTNNSSNVLENNNSQSIKDKIESEFYMEERGYNSKKTVAFENTNNDNIFEFNFGGNNVKEAQHQHNHYNNHNHNFRDIQKRKETDEFEEVIEEDIKPGFDKSNNTQNQNHVNIDPFNIINHVNHISDNYKNKNAQNPHNNNSNTKASRKISTHTDNTDDFQEVEEEDNELEDKKVKKTNSNSIITSTNVVVNDLKSLNKLDNLLTMFYQNKGSTSNDIDNNKLNTNAFDNEKIKNDSSINDYENKNTAIETANNNLNKYPENSSNAQNQSGKNNIEDLFDLLGPSLIEENNNNNTTNTRKNDFEFEEIPEEKIPEKESKSKVDITIHNIKNTTSNNTYNSINEDVEVIRNKSPSKTDINNTGINNNIDIDDFEFNEVEEEEQPNTNYQASTKVVVNISTKESNNSTINNNQASIHDSNKQGNINKPEFQFPSDINMTNNKTNSNNFNIIENTNNQEPEDFEFEEIPEEEDVYIEATGEKKDFTVEGLFAGFMKSTHTDIEKIERHYATNTNTNNNTNSNNNTNTHGEVKQTTPTKESDPKNTFYSRIEKVLYDEKVLINNRMNLITNSFNLFKKCIEKLNLHHERIKEINDFLKTSFSKHENNKENKNSIICNIKRNIVSTENPASSFSKEYQQNNPTQIKKIEGFLNKTAFLIKFFSKLLKLNQELVQFYTRKIAKEDRLSLLCLENEEEAFVEKIHSMKSFIKEHDDELLRKYNAAIIDDMSFILSSFDEINISQFEYIFVNKLYEEDDVVVSKSKSCLICFEHLYESKSMNADMFNHEFHFLCINFWINNFGFKAPY